MGRSSHDRPGAGSSPGPRQSQWHLSEDAFGRLLASLDGDPQRAGDKYESFRRRLIRFFAWEGCLDPEERADETFNRVARRLSQGEAVQSPEKYLFGAARLVLLEEFKQRRKSERATRALAREEIQVIDDKSAQERSASCLEACLNCLAPESRSLILRYYEGERQMRISNRRRLAHELGIPLNALRNRALRLRLRLEKCVRECLSRQDG